MNYVSELDYLDLWRMDQHYQIDNVIRLSVISDNMYCNLDRGCRRPCARLVRSAESRRCSSSAIPCFSRSVSIAPPPPPMGSPSSYKGHSQSDLLSCLGSSDPVRIVGSAVLGIFPHALSLTVAFPPLETASCPVRLLRTKVNCVDEDDGGGTVHRW